MVPLIVLLLVIVLLGGVGFAAHVLWWVLIAALVLWALGFLMGGGHDGRRGWYNWYLDGRRAAVTPERHA